MSGEGITNTYDDAYLLALIAILDAICDSILEDTDAIREVTDAEPVLEETGGSIITDGTEQDIYINNAPAGVFRPVCVKIDFTNQTATETVVIKTYYRISPVAGSALILQDTVTYAGVVSPELINIDLEPNRYGVWVSIQNTAVGVHRAYDWEVFYEVHP